MEMALVQRNGLDCESKFDGPAGSVSCFGVSTAPDNYFPSFLFFSFLFFKKAVHLAQGIPATSMTCPDRQHSLTVAGLAGQLTTRGSL